MKQTTQPGLSCCLTEICSECPDLQKSLLELWETFNNLQDPSWTPCYPRRKNNPGWGSAFSTQVFFRSHSKLQLINLFWRILTYQTVTVVGCSFHDVINQPLLIFYFFVFQSFPHHNYIIYYIYWIDSKTIQSIFFNPALSNILWDTF